VSFVLGNRRFTASVLATVLLGISATGLVDLGLWQLRRAEEKRQLMAAYVQGTPDGTRSAADLSTVDIRSLPRYRQVFAAGRYDGDRQILLDNMPSARGAPGYQVLTPFVLQASGAVLLVDRGWVPLGSTRSVWPSIALGEPGDAATRIIRGRLDELPRPGVRLGHAEVPSGWPKVLNYPQYAELAGVYGERLQPGVLLLGSDEPDGYEREWQLRFGFGPERHAGYAITWFALALTACIIYVVVGFRRPSPGPSSRN
jgi:surfeit locus 1 family protein